jgi:hypothetical protein
MSSKQSHRWNKAWRRHWILTYATPQEFLNASDAGATGLFFGYFKAFINVAFPPPRKTKMVVQHRIPGVLN